MILSLRARIIAALVILALGTTVAVALITTHFLQQSPQVSTSPEMQSALQTALQLAKRDYEARKAVLVQIEQRLTAGQSLLRVVSEGDTSAIAELVGQHDNLTVDTAPVTAQSPPTGIRRTTDGQDRLELRVRTERADGSPVQVVISDELSEMLGFENANKPFDPNRR